METNANQKVSCVVNFAYDASESDELTVRPGDVIRDVDRLPGGWWRGELRGRRGMFPDNFVSVLEQSNTRQPRTQGRCRVVFSYQPANPDELPLVVGDVLEVLGEIEEGWWQGRRHGGRMGVFPSNFVVMLDAPNPTPHFEMAPAQPPFEPAPAVPSFEAAPAVPPPYEPAHAAVPSFEPAPAAVPPLEPAPALPPKPVKELCRALFPYSAVNEDELTLSEGDIVTIVAKDVPDHGWWRGELNGRVGLFPDNFVQLLPAVPTEVEEKKPERPPAKTATVYPILNKYSEKTASVKEFTTSKISVHKENTTSKETSTQSTVTHTNKNESEKIIHSETINDGSLEQVKKPPVPLKKSPTPTSGVGGLFSGLKNKMLSSDKEKSTSTTVSSSGSSSGGEWDRPDGAATSRPTPAANTNANSFDHIERNSLLNDPRAGRVKAPRRRPPSQALRDDTPQQIGLSNGHGAEKPPEKAVRTERPEMMEEIKPRTREWEKHKAPWMEELKLNQAKKTSFIADKPRSMSSTESGVASKAGGGSTDRILDCGLEEKRSTHSMEMSKSTSSISSRMSIVESFEETTKVRHSLDSKKDATPAPRDINSHAVKPIQSPTAAGRTILSMLDEIKKPPAPQPPHVAPPAVPAVAPAAAPQSATPAAPLVAPLATPLIAPLSATLVAPLSAPLTSPAVPNTNSTDKSPNTKQQTNQHPKTTDKPTEIFTRVTNKTSTLERLEKTLDKLPSNAVSGDKPSTGTLERRMHSVKTEKVESNDALIAQLNDRISNLEKLIEVQNTVFNKAIEDLRAKLSAESDKRVALQAELDKLAHCVTQV